MKNENSGTITGIIHDIAFSEIQGKKDPTATYPKYLFTLDLSQSREIKESGKSRYITVPNFPQLESFGADWSNFAVGDCVTISYFAQGRKYTDRDGNERIANKNMITLIKHADLDGGYSNHKGKIKVEESVMPPKANVIPDFPMADDDEFKDLPF